MKVRINFRKHKRSSQTKKNNNDQEDRVQWNKLEAQEDRDQWNKLEAQEDRVQCVFSELTWNTTFIYFGSTPPKIEHTIYHMQSMTAKQTTIAQR
jgi:hypothetical protein